VGALLRAARGVGAAVSTECTAQVPQPQSQPAQIPRSLNQPGQTAAQSQPAQTAAQSQPAQTAAQSQPAQAQPQQAAPDAAAPVAGGAGTVLSLPSAGKRQQREAETAYLAGAKRLERGDLDAAEREFVRALNLDPQNSSYAIAISGNPRAPAHRAGSAGNQASRTATRPGRRPCSRRRGPIDPRIRSSSSTLSR